MGYDVVSLNFGGGIDTKTDSKMVASTKLIYLKDAVFTEGKRVQKRIGSQGTTVNLVGGGTWSSPTMIKQYRNQEVLAATTSNGQRLLSMSTDLNAWCDVGKYTSVAVGRDVINTSTFVGSTPSSIGSVVQDSVTGSANSSCVVIGSIALYAYDVSSVAGSFQSGVPGGFGKLVSSPLIANTYLTVVDLETGLKIYDQLQFETADGHTSIGFSKVAVLGTSQLALFYISSSASNRLACATITITSGGGIVIGNENVIDTCLATSSNTSQYPYCYDYATTSTGAVLSYAKHSASQIITQLINTSGAKTGPSGIEFSASGNIQPISVNADSFSQIWVYWGDGGSYYYAVYDLSLNVIQSKNGIGFPSGAGGTLSQIAGLSISATTQTVYFSSLYYSASTVALGVIRPSIYYASVSTSGGTIAGSGWQLGIDIYGKPMAIGSTAYLPCVSLSQYGSSAFLMDTNQDPSTATTLPGFLPVAKFAYFEAENGFFGGTGVTGSFIAPPKTSVTRYPGFINSLQTVASNKYLIAGGFVASEQIYKLTSSTNLYAGPIEWVYPILGVASYTFDFNSIDAFQGLIQQDTLILNGGIVSMYDGANVSELQYNLDADTIELDPRSSGGSIASGTYNYYYVYQWFDALGNQYLSAPSLAGVVVFSTGSSNSVIINLSVLGLTQKKNVTILLYRTDANETLAYLIATLNNLANNVNEVSALWIDTVTTAASLTSSSPLYTLSGAILENIAPPPSMIMWTNNNRVWCIDSEHPETNVEYTKTASPKTGISFSYGQLEVLIDSYGGPVSGASRMDEKTVILKQNAIGYFIGDGADDAGSGETLTPYQIVPSDVGCSNSKSVVLYPGGLIFRSSNNKGVYQLNRGLQVNYFGFDVEEFNSNNIISALIIPDKTQIRFLSSNGAVSLLYDYFFNQWSVFSYSGSAADNINGSYVYISATGSLQQEVPGYYLTGGQNYFWQAVTSWIKATNIQNFQRLRRFEMLGGYAGSSGHGIQVEAAYDWSTNYSTPVQYFFDGSSSVFQYRERLPIQKCDSVQFRITEITTGASNEYIDLSDMGIEILSKTGLNKLSRTRTVG